MMDERSNSVEHYGRVVDVILNKLKPQNICFLEVEYNKPQEGQHTKFGILFKDEQTAPEIGWQILVTPSKNGGFKPQAVKMQGKDYTPYLPKW